MTHTLPTIVAEIRKQQPGVVPEPLHRDDELESWCWYPDKIEDANDELPEIVAISVVESALWRAWWRGPNPYSLFCHTDDTDPLAMIRALCHARGIVLPEDATP
jgi:hypothetical protein